MAQKRKFNDAKFPEAKNKASKLEISEATKKAMTKNELMNKYNTLIKEHEDLVKLHEENLQRIKDLEKTIKKIKEEDNNQKVHVDVDVQTDDSETCLECEFPANDIWELGEHIYEFHTLKDHGDFACTFCYEKFGRKRDLMVHRKKDHEEKVVICTEYTTGTCTYNREECWWRHEKNNNEDGYSCADCDKTFKNRGDLMKHRKNAHIESVSTCRHALNGRCHFSSKDCWFIHEDERMGKNINEKDNELKNLETPDNEVTERLMNMMEKFTKRIVELEHKFEVMINEK